MPWTALAYAPAAYMLAHAVYAVASGTYRVQDLAIARDIAGVRAAEARWMVADTVAASVARIAEARSRTTMWGTTGSVFGVVAPVAQSSQLVGGVWRFAGWLGRWI